MDENIDIVTEGTEVMRYGNLFVDALIKQQTGDHCSSSCSDKNKKNMKDTQVRFIQHVQPKYVHLYHESYQMLKKDEIY